MTDDQAPRDPAERAWAMLVATIRRNRRLVGLLAVGVLIAVGISVAAFVRSGSDETARTPRAIGRVVPTKPQPPGPNDVLAGLKGRHVSFTRSVPGTRSAGEAVVMPTSRKETVRLVM